MAQPYSEDFRKKVMQAIEWDGLKKSEASQLLAWLKSASCSVASEKLARMAWVA